MGILLVYDVTDERSFNSQSSPLPTLVPHTHTLHDQTSEPGIPTSNSTLPKASTRFSSATSATGPTRRSLLSLRTALRNVLMNDTMIQVITTEQGQELADELGLRYLETSAKTNINVEEAFFALARSVSSPLPSLPVSPESQADSRIAPSDIKARLIDSVAGDPNSVDAQRAAGSSVSVGQGGDAAKSGCC